MSTNLPRLPVDSLLPEICRAIRDGQDVILKASPGSGKTTRVPPALMNTVEGQIWVLEPRRLAARMSAARVAQEMGEKPGTTVGWQMRFESVFSAQTKVLFLTEGMFTARLSQDPSLKGVSCVILDEFHERHQQTDVAFALCRHLKETTRPDLRIIVMSATLDTDVLAAAMPDAKLISVDIPLHPVAIEHWRGDYSDSLVDRAITATAQLAEDKRHNGHILVFLPGTAEIVRVKSGLQRRLARESWLILELRGSLDKTTQDLAFADTRERKVILSTNIAESSITIPGVTAVVDSGLARVPSFNLFTGMSTLETKPVSKASLIQRSGRAGRTGPGLNLRLFTKQDEAARPDTDIPETLRLDLSQVYMSLLWLARKTGGDWQPDHLPWLTPPEPKQWDDAKKLLALLGILTESGALKKSEIALLPIHPRLARFAEACVEHGCGDEAPWLAAILANPDEMTVTDKDYTHLGCDLLARYESFRARPAQSPNVTRAARQIARLLRADKFKEIENCQPPHELSLAASLLAAFPDRVMLIRDKVPKSKQGPKSNWATATLCGGGDLRVALESAAAHGDWLIALDASSTRVAGGILPLSQGPSSNHIATVTMASQITLKDLSTAPAGFLKTEDISEWDEKAGKSRLMRVTRYGVLTVSSQVISPADTNTHQAASSQADTLAKNILKQWPKPFDNADFFDAYPVRQKLAFDANLITHIWDKDELRELLVAQICDEATSFADVTQRPLEDWLRYCVGEDEFTTLQKLAPMTLTVGAGHKVAVHYSESSPPWIEARLQNFFGQAHTPKILEGRVPLTIHLLAPNMRALQVTTDLASFWTGIYPSLRNEYQRKYPRHYWPEDPLQATPPPMKPPRRR